MVNLTQSWCKGPFTTPVRGSDAKKGALNFVLTLVRGPWKKYHKFLVKIDFTCFLWGWPVMFNVHGKKGAWNCLRSEEEGAKIVVIFFFSSAPPLTSVCGRSLRFGRNCRTKHVSYTEYIHWHWDLWKEWLGKVKIKTCLASWFFWKKKEGRIFKNFVVLEGKPLLWSQNSSEMCLIHLQSCIQSLKRLEHLWDEVITKNLQNKKKFVKSPKWRRAGTLNLFILFFFLPGLILQTKHKTSSCKYRILHLFIIIIIIIILC